MAVHGYLLIEGEMWWVAMRQNNTQRSLKRRKTGTDGDHLVDVQAFLEQSENAWLLDHLRYGDRVYLPGGKR